MANPVDCLQKIIQLLYIEPNSTTDHVKYVLQKEDAGEVDKSIQFLMKWGLVTIQEVRCHKDSFLASRNYIQLL